ncbi:MAG TPA: hypothetical protein VLL07_00295 [Pontiella sp.]|nr:hypothetical protein [Pontiella sp.]
MRFAGRKGHLPRAQIPRNPEHPQVGVEKGRIDRETHEPHVDTAAGADQQTRIPRQILPPEQPAHPPEYGFRHQQLFHHRNVTGLIDQNA